ncbi:MAG: AMP-binding protein [Candidatus Latescibacteria bacterium]|jgi:long-chain acyl-CoA synthetase|nr:AMP-binding protein [Candidatus Latescibacterota bacterium]
MAENLRDLLDESFERNADLTAVRVLRQSDQQGDRGLTYAPTTYRQLKEQRDRLASGLAQQGLVKGQRVGVLTDGGLEPVLVFLAADMLGLSSVPLCCKLPDDILVHNINRSGIALLFVDPSNLDQIERVSDRLDDPPQVVLTEGEGRGARTFFDLMKAGGNSPPPQVELGPDDESKVVFTSGSSGMPKGVIQTHQNIVDNVRSVWSSISEREPTILFKSAPDYHTLGILNIYYPLAKGWTLDLPRSPDRVLSDIRHAEPYAFLTVPLVLDKVYGNVRKEIDAGGAKGWLVGRAVRAKQRIARGGASLGDYLVQGMIGRKVVAQIKSKLSERVGNRLELLIVGAAKADPEALDFFQDVLDIKTLEGYGVTECAPLIAVNTLEARKVGSVGRPLIRVKIVREDGEEIGHGDPATGTYQSSEGEAGELWVSGTHVMRGYLDDPEQTQQALVDDEEGRTWYRTGDLFDIDGEGFLTFRGRLGRQFKLRNGEFVNPELLERIYARVSLIEHVLVCGDQSRTYPLPLVTVNADEARIQTDIPNLPENDDDALRRHPAIAERIRELLLKEATIAGLPGHERPQRVLVAPEPLTEEAGTLTRGLKKLVPKAILERYRQEIEEAYQS